MKATELTDKALRNEIYKLRRKLRTSVGEVKELAKTSPIIPTYAVSHMQKLERIFRKTSVSNMSNAELLSTYRELKYVEGLKTSTKEGAIKSSEVFTPIEEKLKAFSPELREQFWQVYGKAYGEQKLLDRYKYEIFDTVIDRVNSSTDSGEMALKVVDAYQKTLEKEGKNTTDDKFILSFTKELQDLL